MRVLLGGLPLVAFASFWALALRIAWLKRANETRPPAGAAFLYAAITWGVCVAIFTQSLSLAHNLTSTALAACWVVASMSALAFLTWDILRTHRGGVSANRWPEAQQSDLKPPAAPQKYASVWYISVVMTALILGITALTAWNVPPNNWDAMTYHLARVQHWVQNQSVAFYPTNDPRQLFDPPWAEYAILQFQLLTGGDYLANFVQWFSNLGICVAVPLIARRLGANRAGQGLAMIVAATTPMAVLQSASPQNDLVTSFWVVCLVYCALAFVEKPSLPLALAVGCSLGVATLTKGTAYVYAAPVLLGLALWLARRLWGFARAFRGFGGAVADWSWLRSGALLCLAAILMLALNGWQYAQNSVTFQAPLGPDGQAYANQTFAPPALICNAARDISLELGVSSPALNLGLYHNVVAICSAVGVSANDPRISWTGLNGLPFRINPANAYEGSASNLAQFGLIALALLLAFALRRLRARRDVLVYAALLLTGFALYIAYLRWQPWGSRLLLPWFIAAAPLVGVALDRLFAARLSVPALELTLLVLASPYLLTANNAPLLGPTTVFNSPRVTQYFISDSGIQRSYTDAASYLNHRGCQEVGFSGPAESWEYPFWVLLGPKPFSARIEQVLVTNPSARYTADPRYQRFRPCAIISIVDPAAPKPSAITFHAVQYQLSWSQAGVAIYLPNTAATAAKATPGATP